MSEKLLIFFKIERENRGKIGFKRERGDKMTACRR